MAAAPCNIACIRGPSIHHCHSNIIVSCQQAMSALQSTASVLWALNPHDAYQFVYNGRTRLLHSTCSTVTRQGKQEGLQLNGKGCRHELPSR